MIPRIIHQIWGFWSATAVPPKWMELAQTWKRRHPEWHYRFWTAAECRDVVETHYPELLGMYDAYPFPVQRADAARYCLLHYFGGVYADLDMECLRRVDPLISDHRMVVVREPPAHRIGVGDEVVLSNAFMAAEPRHAFLNSILRELAADSRIAVTHRDVLDTTGPCMLGRVFSRNPRADVYLAEDRVAFPYARETSSLRVILNRGPAAVLLRLHCILKGAYAVHHWANSWYNLGGEALVNPDPHRVDGFVFFPKRDSPGFDLRNGGRNVPELARTCAASDAVIAFNTDGFLKARLRPREEWQQWDDRADNEGLYIKRSAFLESPGDAPDTDC